MKFPIVSPEVLFMYENDVLKNNKYNYADKQIHFLSFLQMSQRLHIKYLFSETVRTG